MPPARAPRHRETAPSDGSAPADDRPENRAPQASGSGTRASTSSNKDRSYPPGCRCRPGTRRSERRAHPPSSGARRPPSDCARAPPRCPHVATEIARAESPRSGPSAACRRHGQRELLSPWRPATLLDESDPPPVHPARPAAGRPVSPPAPPGIHPRSTAAYRRSPCRRSACTTSPLARRTTPRGIAFRSTPQTADPRPRPRSLRPECQCRSTHALCSQAAARAPSSRSDARLGPVRSHRFAYEKVAHAFRHSAHYSSKVGLQQVGFDGRLGLLIHSNIFVEPNENKMSDAGRGRASLGVKVWKSSQKVEATTVRRSLHRMVRSLWVYWRAVAQRSERSSITSSSPSSPSHISSRASWNPHFCKTRIEAKLCFATCA